MTKANAEFLERLVSGSRDGGMKFIVVTADGGIYDRNDFGKASRWAFANRGSAECNARRTTGFVYDASERRVYEVK